MKISTIMYSDQDDVEVTYEQDDAKETVTMSKSEYAFLIAQAEFNYSTIDKGDSTIDKGD